MHNDCDLWVIDIHRDFDFDSRVIDTEIEILSNWYF